MAEVIDRKDTTSLRTVDIDMNEKEDMDMSDQQQQTPPPPSASKLLQQHTQSNTPTMSVEEKASSNIPFRGFVDNDYKKVAPQDTTQHQNTTQPGPVATFFKGLFSPRATDIQQLLIKLQTQFTDLEFAHKKYILMHNGSRWDDPSGPSNKKQQQSKEDLSDPRHPLNNPNLITEVHFVGRKATNQPIIDLSNLLMNRDHFGSITELWLNNNLISDDGAEKIASFLELPSCALIELWLGDNNIGASGTTLISAALSNNVVSKLKCLGLYKNKIGNGGALSLAQMLRKNNTLSTLDIHGCGNRGSRGQEVIEGYGCKVVKGSDGTEYVARVIQSTEEDEGLVTDHRLLDAIQTFVAFNRINPTREQAVRGIMASNKISQDDTEEKEDQKQSNVAMFLSELSNKPANEELTCEEKRKWKDYEWDRLYVEKERARQAQSALAAKLDLNIKEEVNFENDNDGTFPLDDLDEEKPMIGKDLDDEVVKTDTRSWKDLKMGITGSTKACARPRKATDSNADDGEKIDETLETVVVPSKKDDANDVSG